MLKNGTIKQQPCALCNNFNSQKHHPDYNDPLLIVWLCADCHRALHKNAKVEGAKVEEAVSKLDVGQAKHFTARIEEALERLN